MSEEEDNDSADEFESELEEDSEENEYKESLKHHAGKLKEKRMAARPSTIVQVSTGPLEFHLQSIKKQLKAHAILINHPPFLDDLMVEVNKISGLVRKIEHCQLDINNVRETFIDKQIGDASLSSSSQQVVSSSGASTDVSISEKVNHLFKDLEMVRAVVRRIDVHHALDATVLVRVTALAKNLKKLKEFSEKMLSKNLRIVQDEIKTEILSVNSRIQKMDELHLDKFNEVFARIQKTEENLYEGQKEETKRLAKKVEYIEEHLTTDFYDFKEKIDSQLAITKKTAMQAFLKISKGSLGSGMQLIEEYTHKRIIKVLRTRFITWRNYDPIGILHRGRRLIALTKRAHKKMLTRSALFEWKSYHEKQKERERMRSYMTNIINKWRAIAFPLLSKRFHTWKRYCVFMRFHMIERKAVLNSTANVIPKDNNIEKYNNHEYDELISTMNPSSDIEGSFQLTGLYVDRIYNKINQVQDSLKSSDITTRRMGQRMDGIRNTLMETLDKRCGDAEKQQKTQAKQFSQRIKEINSEHVESERVNAKRFVATSEEVKRLESSVFELTFRVEEQSSRLERLFSLHQKMLDRIDAVETTQKAHEKHLAEIDTQITTIGDKNIHNEAEIMLHKKMTETSITTLKEDIHEIQYISKDCSEKMQAVLSNQSHGNTAVSNLTKDFKHKISNIESWLNTTAPKPPSPKLLVTLALKFEDRAVEKHCKDPAHMFSVSMSTELAKDIATCAHWLVYHIVEATDVDVLTRIMKGPQEVATVFDQADPINSLHPPDPQDRPASASGAPKPNTKASHLTHEEFCATTRESMLLRYLESFQKQLNQSRDEVGLIRKEARSLFLKRFIDSLDLSLQKHDVIVLKTASAMGRNPGHVTGRPNNDVSGPPACVACDRPLRMRTTTRSIGELYEKLLLSGKKSSELKREVLRNQITTSPQNHPTSPVHNYKFDVEVNKRRTGEKHQPIYSDDKIESNNSHNYNYNTSSNDFNQENEYDGMGSRRPGGQSIVRIRPTSARPQSAPRQHLASSQSAAQLTSSAINSSDIAGKTRHIPRSPSKGGGFKTTKSSTQELLAEDIANGLHLDPSIPLRHSIDHLPTATRKLVGKFQHSGDISTGDINGDGNHSKREDISGEDATPVYLGGNGLKGSFIPSGSTLPRYYEGPMSDTSEDRDD